MKPARAAVSAALVASAVLLAPAPAGADEKDQARALLVEGNRLAEQGDLVTALERFRAAYARYASPKILLNIGTTLWQLGRNAEAAEVYDAYLRDPAAERQRSDEVRKILADIDAKVGRVRIEIAESDARLRLDGKPLPAGPGPLVVRVEPGEHTLVADREGSAAAVETIVVAAREERIVRLRFVPLRSEAPQATASAAPAGAPTRSRGPVGPSAQRTTGFVIGGLGIAGVAAGAVFGILAKTTDATADDHCLSATACDPEGVRLGNHARTQATVSTVLFAAGAGVAVLGLVLFATAPRSGVRTASAPPRVHTRASPIAAVGRWIW